MTRRGVPEPEAGNKLPACADMKKLRFELHWTYQDFMDAYGVTNQAVQRKLNRCGLTASRMDYAPEIPWKIRKEHQWTNTLRQLRVAVREKRGVLEPMEPAKRRDYDNFRTKLAANDAVVGYGLHLDEAGNETFGFYFAPRREGVDAWLIREPKRRSQ